MFETGIRQFRMAMAMVNGRRIRPQLIQRLVADADATLREFGSPGDDVDELLDGPFADPETRAHFQTQGLRRTARRLARRSPFYAARFAEAGVDPKRLDLTLVDGDPDDDEGRSRRPRRPAHLHGLVAVSQHPHDRHHRDACRGLAVTLRGRAVAGDGRPVRTVAQRDQPHRLPADQPQLPSHRSCAARHRGVPTRRRQEPGTRPGARRPQPRQPARRARRRCRHHPRHLPQLPRPARHRGPPARARPTPTSRCDASTSPASCSPRRSPRRPTTPSVPDRATRSR